jgi:GNAT superfamily N-acetyltransferase
MTDSSNGYEGVAAAFLAGRGRAPPTAVGASQVRAWARSLPAGAAVIDLGCGTGLPITKVLVDEGLNVHAVDAAPSFVEAFRNNLPGIPVACESVESSRFFGRTFDGVVAWGLVFLLSDEQQRRLIPRIADVLEPGGRLLFTSPVEAAAWNDVLTGVESRSLGGAEYRRLLASAGLSVEREYEDAGQNHYFEAIKLASSARPDAFGRVRIVTADLDDARVRALLEEHLTTARATSPPCSAHALDLTGLRAPELTVWAAWEGDVLLGVGALKELAPDHGEIKSMHTARAHRRRGIGAAILRHIVAAARARNMARLSLETGSAPYFAPARALYREHGFVECPPFADYVEDPHSVFMTRTLR